MSEQYVNLLFWGLGQHKHLFYVKCVRSVLSVLYLAITSCREMPISASSPPSGHRAFTVTAGCVYGT